MGANKLALPAHKDLVANLNQMTTTLTALATASRGKKPMIRIPASVALTMKNFAKVSAWIGKSEKAYGKLLAASTGDTTPAPKAKTKGAAG